MDHPKVYRMVLVRKGQKCVQVLLKPSVFNRQQKELRKVMLDQAVWMYQVNIEKATTKKYWQVCFVQY